MITSEQIKLLPHEPGVYMMKDADGQIVYVGKANDIQKRIRSHCQRRDGSYASPFVEMVDKVDFIVTDNEVEALVLENNLIKKHYPPCNVKLKDDKRYPYIKITNEAFPRCYITRSADADGAQYFGPYPHVSQARRALSALHEIFSTRTCKFDSDKLLNIRPCLDYEMGRCCAPCGEEVSQEDYMSLCQGIAHFLNGNHDMVLGTLEDKMAACSEAMLFEKAAFYRDVLAAAKHFAQEQKMQRSTVENQDFVGCARVHDIACIAVIRRRGGRVVGSTRHLMDDVTHAETPEIINAFLEQFYLRNTDIPKEIFISSTIGAERLRRLESVLGKISQKPARLKIPRRGAKHHMLQLAEKNSRLGAEQQYRKLRGVKHGVDASVIALQESLRLEVLPLRIEGYDIANTQGQDSVGAMVVFHGGKPEKSSYRRFKINTVSQPDDYASMQEMLRRRFTHQEGTPDANEESALKSEFAKPPDLVMIDGGKGHLNAALEVLDELDIRHFPICSLAKREEEIFLPGVDRPVKLPRRHPGLRLLQQVRDEAHRFGNAFHKKLRGKSMRQSTLRNVPGVGPKRERVLLKHFGSLEKMRGSSLDEFLDVKGVTQTLAQALVDHFAERKAGR